MSSQYQKTIDDDIDIVWRCTQVFPARIIIINSRAEPGQMESLRKKYIVWGGNYNMRSTMHNFKFSLRIRVSHTLLVSARLENWKLPTQISGKINFQLLLLLFLEIFFWYPSKVGRLFPKNVVRSSIKGYVRNLIARPGVLGAIVRKFAGFLRI